MTGAEEIALGELLFGILSKALDVFAAAKAAKVSPADAAAALATARAQLDDAHAAALKNAQAILDERFPKPDGTE